MFPHLSPVFFFFFASNVAPGFLKKLHCKNNTGVKTESELERKRESLEYPER